LTGQEQDRQNEASRKDENGASPSPEQTLRRKFVEPEMSQPIDVLEATTFFQAVDSGATG